MNLEQLIERLEQIRAMHPNAEVKFLISTERGEQEFEITAVNYFHVAKLALLE